MRVNDKIQNNAISSLLSCDSPAPTSPSPRIYAMPIAIRATIQRENKRGTEMALLNCRFRFRTKVTNIYVHFMV